MRQSADDTLADLGRGIPSLFIVMAFGLPPLIGVQFLVAGQALFGGLPWGIHSGLGGIIGLDLFALFGYSLAVRRLGGFGWWAGVQTLLYGLQLTLASSGPAALAFHPFNAAVLLTASLIFLCKVQRRRTARSA